MSKRRLSLTVSVALREGVAAESIRLAPTASRAWVLNTDKKIWNAYNLSGEDRDEAANHHYGSGPCRDDRTHPVWDCHTSAERTRVRLHARDRMAPSD